ncbi:MAG: DUF4340 domain-containing protein [Ignavibacteria bacterium]|nr:DUF4340 domain-containing protein [Ignavibacteria bacterium]
MQKISWPLIAVLVVLLIATIVVLNRPGESSRTASTGKYLVEYDSSVVDKIEITAGTSDITLEKEAGVWKITSPVQAKAEQKTVESAVGRGTSLEISTPVSANPEKQRLFLVDSSGPLVTFFARGTPAASVRIGKSGPTFTDTYIRLEGSDEVYLTQGLGNMFVRQINDWRDKTIFKTEAEFIKEVSFHFGDTTFALILQDSVWRIGAREASEPAVRGFLSSLSNFMTDTFVDSMPAAVPPLTATITVAGTEIHFYRQDDGTKYYVQTSTSPQWFEIQQWRANQLLKREKDFLPAST